jgi:hypothetical protein
MWEEGEEEGNGVNITEVPYICMIIYIYTQ